MFWTNNYITKLWPEHHFWYGTGQNIFCKETKHFSSNDKVFLTFFLGAALAMASCCGYKKSYKSMATIFTALLASDIYDLVTRLVLSRFPHVPPTQTAVNTLTVVNDR